MSISRGCGRADTSWAIATSSSVCLPARGEHGHHAAPSSARWTMRRAAFLMRSASATEVPPNFMTTVCVRSPTWRTKIARRPALASGRPGRPRLGSWSSDAACSRAALARRGGPVLGAWCARTRPTARSAPRSRWPSAPSWRGIVPAAGQARAPRREARARRRAAPRAGSPAVGGAQGGAAVPVRVRGHRPERRDLPAPSPPRPRRDRDRGGRTTRAPTCWASSPGRRG